LRLIVASFAGKATNFTSTETPDVADELSLASVSISVRLRYPDTNRSSVIAQKVAIPCKTCLVGPSTYPSQLEQLLVVKNGEPLPFLTGTLSTNKHFVDLAREMLQRQIAVFAADPEDSLPSHTF
jgi:hypothetical protein